MSTYVLIHGAASDGFYWHWVAPLLEAAGHRVVTPDLPNDTPSSTLDDYAQAAIDAAGAVRGELVVVGQSLGGFTAPIVAERLGADLLILVAAMTPRPGEPAAEWWGNTGFEQARGGGELDEIAEFFHDVPDDVRAEALARPEHGEAEGAYNQPWPLPAWPSVPTRFILCRDDRFFPADFQRRVVRERLGIECDEIDGGHLPAFSRPRELVDALERIRVEELR